MITYLIRRVLSIFVTLFFVVTITFIMLHSIPGGPFTSEKPLPPEIEAAMMAKYKLDLPLHQQYTSYLKDLVKGDMGPSLKYQGRDVSEMILDGFPISAQLGALAIIIIVIIGIPIGVIAALKQNTWIDKTVMFFAIFGVTIPSFVVGTLLVFVFASHLKVLPAFGWGTAKQAIMPTIALSASSIAYMARLTRSSMLEVINQDYIRTARAKGLSEMTIVFKHALRNALIPIVTFLGPLIAAILTGSFVTEKIFAIPGMGDLFVKSINNRDYTLVMGTTIFYAFILVVVVLIVDLIYGLIDPKIKISK